MKNFIAGAFARLNNFIGAIASSIGPREGALLLGLGLLGYGASLVYWAAGFLLPGIVLIYVAIVGLP